MKNTQQFGFSMLGDGVGKKAGKLVVVVITSLSLVYVPMSTALVFSEVSTEELADMRGKFLSKDNRVSYFGISMRTHWNGGGDRHHSAGLKWEAKKTTGGYRTKYSRYSKGNKVENAEPLTGANPALTQIAGSVQSVQIAGSGNSVENNVALDVENTSASEIPITQDTSDSSITSSVSSSSPTIATYRTADGVTTQFTKGEVLGLSIESEGSRVVQQIGTNPITNTRQLLQSVSLRGNNQKIINNIRLQVGLNHSSRLRHSVRNSSLLGLR